MNFLSDTTAPAHPALFDALTQANKGFAPSYGADPVSAEVKERLREVFETDLEVVFTVSGTASNALALSVLCPPDGMVLCHDEAHIHRDERGAPEFFTKGGKLLPLQGPHAKLSPDALADALKQWPSDFVHATPPAVLSLSQLNESGCAYSLDELDVLIGQAKARDLKIHMDGARFSNALVTLGCSPAQMTWKAGVDSLSLGATKNGALASEAVILFPSVKDQLPRLLAHQKRAGLMLPKMRYVSAQMGAWLDNNLWLDLARTANAAAKRLSDGLASLDGAELVHPTHGNEVFIRLEDELALRLREAGAGFYSWPDGSARFVTSWCTTDDDISALLEAAG